MKTDKSLVCSDKTWLFLQTSIITFNSKYNFWVFYRWTDVLSFYSFKMKALQLYVVIYFHQRYIYHYIFYLFVF
jgi:hypothetical protein